MLFQSVLLSLLVGVRNTGLCSIDDVAGKIPCPLEPGHPAQQGVALLQVPGVRARSMPRKMQATTSEADMENRSRKERTWLLQNAAETPDRKLALVLRMAESNLADTNLTDSATCDPPEREPLALPAIGESVFGPNTGFSSLHDVVGPDGVLMISLDRISTRYAYSAYQLNRIGIRPVKLSATDGSCSSPSALAKGCYLDTDTQDRCQLDDKKAGLGCVSRVEQAISDSHRRALEHAYSRNDYTWTAILEDDAAPITQDGVDWNEAFREAWQRLPEGAKMVRLSWCTMPDFAPAESLLPGQFGFKQSWDVLSIGGCTTAYMVHRSIIPQLLQVFPCCGAVDACFIHDFFLKPDGSGGRNVDTVLLNLDAHDSSSWVAARNLSLWGSQYGVMMPALDLSLSTRLLAD